MAQAVWTGDIAFGLIQIPVKLYSAQRRTGLSFRMLDSRDAARVRFERVNDDTGEEVPWDQIVKGYEYDGGNYVLLDSADFEAAAEEPTREIEIERFVALDAIEPAYFEKPYYLIANQKKPKGYVLLRETLADTGQAGIAKIVIRGREHLCAIYAEDNALILNMLRFDQELRDLGNFSLPSGPVSDFDISKKEAAMAEELVESMSGEWEPEAYHDEYRQALLDYIERKAEADGKSIVAREDKDDTADTDDEEKVVDFADQLARSVTRQKSSGTAANKKSSKSGSNRSKSGNGSKNKKKSASQSPGKKKKVS